MCSHGANLRGTPLVPPLVSAPGRGGSSNYYMNQFGVYVIIRLGLVGGSPLGTRTGLCCESINPLTRVEHQTSYVIMIWRRFGGRLLTFGHTVHMSTFPPSWQLKHWSSCRRTRFFLRSALPPRGGSYLFGAWQVRLPCQVQRGFIDQVWTPVCLRTRLIVKNTRGIFKVCGTVREGHKRPKR